MFPFDDVIMRIKLLVHTVHLDNIVVTSAEKMPHYKYESIFEMSVSYNSINKSIVVMRSIAYLPQLIKSGQQLLPTAR